jgi:hypothetical protein
MVLKPVSPACTGDGATQVNRSPIAIKAPATRIDRQKHACLKACRKGGILWIKPEYGKKVIKSLIFNNLGANYIRHRIGPQISV